MREMALMDEKGRVTFGKEDRKRYGRKFWILRLKDEIVLKPVPRDPVADLQRMWKEAGLNKYSIKQIKKMAEEEAEKEAWEGWKRSQRAGRK